jgi:hypothetical protein
MNCVRISGVLAEIRTQYPPNMSLESYRCTNPLGFIPVSHLYAAVTVRGPANRFEVAPELH